MAELRIPPALPPSSAPVRPVPAARAEAIRAAQRAFFDTAADAATQAAPPEAAAAVEPTPAAAPVRELRAAVDPAAPPPSRLLRPGSLLDIKV